MRHFDKRGDWLRGSIAQWAAGGQFEYCTRSATGMGHWCKRCTCCYCSHLASAAVPRDRHSFWVTARRGWEGEAASSAAPRQAHSTGSSARWMPSCGRMGRVAAAAAGVSWLQAICHVPQACKGTAAAARLAAVQSSRPALAPLLPRVAAAAHLVIIRHQRPQLRIQALSEAGAA